MGLQVSTLNVIRSGLSFFLSPLFDVGEDPHVKRIFRFFWRKRPVFPRFRVTWDVSQVLTYLSSLHPPSSLSLKFLTLKALTLLAICSSDRAQTLESIDIEHSEVTADAIYFPIYTLLKCSKRNRKVTVVKCVKFEESELDVSLYVTSYLQRTLALRIRSVRQGLPKPRQLFLSYFTGKPLRRASIAKYLLDTLSLAGIDTSCFRAHSTRGALPSVMARKGCSPHVILEQGDWKRLGTFQRYYNKPSDTSVEGRLIARVVNSD